MRHWRNSKIPNLKEHCEYSLKIFGVDGKNIHKWMDAPVKKFAGQHRKFRHDFAQKLPSEITVSYKGDLAYQIMKHHILLDSTTSRIPQKSAKKYEEMIKLKDIFEETLKEEFLEIRKTHYDSDYKDAFSTIIKKYPFHDLMEAILDQNIKSLDQIKNMTIRELNRIGRQRYNECRKQIRLKVYGSI